MNDPARLLPIIDGQEPSAAAFLPLEDPASATLTGEVAECGAADIHRAVAAARAAFDRGDWRDRPLDARMAVLERLADAIAAHAGELARLDRIDMGKPVAAGIEDATDSADIIREAARGLPYMDGALLASDPQVHAFVRHEPLGVVAAVTPWNYPTPNACHKLGAVLATGNSLILKPSEIASRSTLLVARLAFEAGVPASVLHVVTGGGAVGRMLSRHDDIDLISFTGSTAAGRDVMRGAGESNGKRVLAELGGKSPQIMFADAGPVEALAETALAAAFANSGQLCVAKSRLLVERSLAGPLKAALAAALPRFRPGDPADPATRYGPVASAAQHRRILGAVSAGRDAGVACIAAEGPAAGAGYFVEPTLFLDPPADHAIVREEIFGPVLAVCAFEDEADAVRQANATAYGLAASIHTRDIGRAHRIGRALKAGYVTLFTGDATEGRAYAVSSEPAAASGFGVEGGLDGLRAYCRRKTMIGNLG